MGIRARRFIGLMLALSCMVSNTGAEDLGRKTTTYPADRDGREQLKDIVRQKMASGEVARYWAEYQRKTLEAIRNPAPLGVRTSYQNYARDHAVRFTFAADMKDESGNVVVRRGTTIEPLKISPLTDGLIFIDGRDQRQIDFAIAKGQQAPFKIVLTAGSFVELRERYRTADWRGSKGIPFYFDQRKIIINTLQRLYGIPLDSVPASVTQKGTGLHVEYGLGGRQ